MALTRKVKNVSEQRARVQSLIAQAQATEAALAAAEASLSTLDNHVSSFSAK